MATKILSMNKANWRQALLPYTNRSNFTAFKQVLVTATLYGLSWYFYDFFINQHEWLILPFIFLHALFILRFFVLMHDCGHGSLFGSNFLNRFVGFLLGVLTGMPQYVWSKHHAYHHKTNGDWKLYKGPLSTISLKEYEALPDNQKRLYRLSRHPLAFVPIGGFLYVLFNPRFNWFVGTFRLLKTSFFYTFTAQFGELKKLWRELPSKKWKTPKEFWHMTYNNVTLLSLWVLLSYAFGADDFLPLYFVSLSLAGGLGILFFTVQHNFEDSYASDTERVDPVRASLEGTSFLVLPKWLNWFTADIAFHHIHHLSTMVPNYNLAACHNELGAHFKSVKRIYPQDILSSVQYVLWDQEKQKLVKLP
jgi:acyl-lipid omega-6 desaturase (Delta-12 desaturase)